VHSGATAHVRIDAYPDKVFEGRIGYVYPTLNAETRTVAVRIELANPGLLLKPAMFARVDIPVGGKGQVVTVPTSAVIDSGTRRIVLVAEGEGRFAPREVKLGARGDNHVQVLEGVKVGEDVVVAANFLIDAESNLKAALGGFEAPGQTPPVAKGAGHRVDATVESLDPQAGTVMLEHGPVASLKWPAMSMEFKLANPAQQSSLAPGTKVTVEFVERQPGEWVITSVSPRSTAPTPHAGH